MARMKSSSGSDTDRRTFSRVEATAVATILLVCGAVLLTWGESAGWPLILLAGFAVATQLQAPAVPIAVITCPPPLERESTWEAPMPRALVEETPTPPMLAEVPHTRQIVNESRRRWFSSRNMDLIVWLDAADQASGFQLCYDKLLSEKAFEWRRNIGYKHMNVDDGEDRPRHHKRSPVLVPDGYFDARRVAALFDEQSMLLPRYLFELVAGQIAAHPNFAG